MSRNRKAKTRYEKYSDQQRIIEGECVSKFKTYLSGQRDYYRAPHIDYWRKFVEDFYDPNAVEKLCIVGCRLIPMCRDNCIHVKGHARRCEICKVSSGRAFEVTTESLPRLLESKYKSGLISDIIRYDEDRPVLLVDGNFSLKIEKILKEMVYIDFTVVYEGKLHVLFKNNAKILSLQFCAKSVQIYVPSYQIPRSLSLRPMSSTKCYVPMSDERFQQYAAILNFDIDSHIDRSGLPRSYHRYLMMLARFDPLKDLIYCSSMNRCGPLEAMEKLKSS